MLEGLGDKKRLAEVIFLFLPNFTFGWFCRGGLVEMHGTVVSSKIVLSECQLTDGFDFCF